MKRFSIFLMILLAVHSLASAQKKSFWLCNSQSITPPAPETELFFSIQYRGDGNKVVHLVNTDQGKKTASIRDRFAKFIIDGADKTSDVVDTSHLNATKDNTYSTIGYAFGDYSLHRVDIYTYKETPIQTGSAFHSLESIVSAEDGGNIKRYYGCFFKHCVNLEQIIIRSNVDTIGHQCFHSCTSLKNIIVQAPKPPVLLLNPPVTGSGLWFLGIDATVATLHIMPDTYLDYDNSQWFLKTGPWSLSNVAQDADSFSSVF